MSKRDDLTASLAERKQAKCETCALRGTPWRGGCEWNFSGLEQFDFYQKRKEMEEKQHE